MKKSLIALVTSFSFVSSFASASYYGGIDAGFGGQLRSTQNGLTPPGVQTPLLYNQANTATGLGAFAYGVHLGALTSVNHKGFAYGLELGFTNYGNYGISTLSPLDTTIKTSSFNALAVLKRHFDNGFNLAGKAGMAYMMQQAFIQNSSFESSTTVNYPNAYLPLFAVGAEYDLLPRFHLPLLMGITYQVALATLFNSDAPLPLSGSIIQHSPNPSSAPVAGQSNNNALLMSVSYEF